MAFIRKGYHNNILYTNCNFNTGGVDPSLLFCVVSKGVTRRDAPPHLLVLQLKEMTTYKGHPSLPYVVSTKVRGGAA